MAKKTSEKAAPVAKPKASEVVHVIPLSSIDVPSDWNVRSGNFTESTGSEEENEFKDLVSSIGQEGVRIPVLVRPLENGRFSLVAGFRRLAAVRAIATAQRNGNPSIPAIVRELTPSQARLENALENLARDNLRTADKAFALADSKACLIEDGGYTTDGNVFARAGVSQSFGAKLLQIQEKLKPELFDLWRKTPAKLNVLKVLDVAKKPRPEQDEAFRALLAGAGKASNPSGRGGKPPQEKYENRVKNAAELLGRLYRTGLLSWDSGHCNAEFCRVVTEYDASAENAPSIDWRAASKVAKMTFELAAGLVEPEPDEDEDEDE